MQLGEGEPRAVFIAHMDEIGFRVSRIRSDGSPAADAVGGGAAERFAYHAVRVHGEEGPLPAIMTRHGTIDIGATSVDQAAELGVKPGSTATVPKRFRVLSGGRISARSLDDRVGCAVLLRVLRSLGSADSLMRVTRQAVQFVFSVNEEGGLVGAEAAAGRAQPQRVYAIDSFVSSDSPLESRRVGFAELGKGFVIRAMDNSGISPIEAVRRIADLAREKKIPVQYGVTAGGNDGSRFVPRGRGERSSELAAALCPYACRGRGRVRHRSVVSDCRRACENGIIGTFDLLTFFRSKAVFNDHAAPVPISSPRRLYARRQLRRVVGRRVGNQRRRRRREAGLGADGNSRGGRQDGPAGVSAARSLGATPRGRQASGTWAALCSRAPSWSALPREIT